MVERMNVFIGMIWHQYTTVYTNYNNRMHDALGFTSD